jgi:hypothetical protein
MEYTTGQFRSFRAVTKVHLGAIETDLHPGDVVQYDGQTLKLGSNPSGGDQGWLASAF